MAGASREYDEKEGWFGWFKFKAFLSLVFSIMISSTWLLFFKAEVNQQKRMQYRDHLLT